MPNLLKKIINSEILAGSAFYKLVAIISIIIFTIIIERVFTRFIKKYFSGSTEKINVDPTNFAISRRVVSFLIYISGFSLSIYIIPELKALAISMFAGAGVLALMIGLAAQKAFSNLISGIFIAIFKPFRVGDVIKFDEKIGSVEDITLRHTIIKNFENKRYIIPNSVISEQVIENFNIKEEKTCKLIDIGISYDSDINRAMKIITREITKHGLFIDNRSEEELLNKEPVVKIKVINLGEYSVDIRAWAWAKDPKDAFEMGCDLYKSIKEKFDKENIEIPFPHRTIVYKEKPKFTKSRKQK